MKFTELSYANDDQPKLKRMVIRLAEGMSGRAYYGERYFWWREHVAPTRQRVFGGLLALADISLSLRGNWPPKLDPAKPLVLVANHPFGIGDGIAVLSMAEALGRPFRVLVHSDLLKISELRPYALAVDFSETKEAMKRNLEMRREALQLLREGTTIVIFPAGAVATAPNIVGRADDLPWKLFTAKLIQDAQADVLPIFFFGQNSLAFHAVSKVSLTLRLALLVREFRRLAGRTMVARVGKVIHAEELAERKDRNDLIRFLRDRVFALGKERELNETHQTGELSPRRRQLGARLRLRGLRFPRRLPAGR